MVKKKKSKASVDFHIARNLSGYLWTHGKSRARRLGIEFTIKPEDVKIPTHCPLLGIPIFRGSRTAKRNSPSLDRINNDLGYIPGNVWVISLRANTLKSNATAEELTLLANGLRQRKADCGVMIKRDKPIADVFPDVEPVQSPDLAAPPPDYFDAPDYSKPVREIVYRDLLTGEAHTFLLSISPQRVDQFVCTVDGKPWLQKAGWSRILAGLRKAVPRFSQFA